jgi:uncharacterized lipoprotein YbaY
MSKRILASIALCVGLAACAAIQQVGLPSPEAQITAGAQAATAATTTATTLLREQKITVPQAKSYRNMLAAAGESLKDANTELLACRAQTGSTAKTTPDPCWAKISEVVRIALENIGSVKKTLSTK